MVELNAKRYNELDYVYAVARTKMISINRLDAESLEKMINSATFDDACKVLVDLGWTEAGLGTDFELMLNGELDKTYRFMEKMDVPLVTGVQKISFDYHNAKVLMKSEFSRRKSGHYMFMPNGNIPLEHIKKIFLERDYHELGSSMEKAVLKVIEDYPRLKDPKIIDFVFDAAMFYDMNEFVRKNIFDKDVRELFSVQIDLHNIKSFVRCVRLGLGEETAAAAFAPGGTLSEEFFIQNINADSSGLKKVFEKTPYAKAFEDDLSENLECSLDKYLISYVEKARKRYFGIFPLYGYLLRKQIEVQNARIVLICKKNNISADVIRSKLRL